MQAFKEATRNNNGHPPRMDAKAGLKIDYPSDHGIHNETWSAALSAIRRGILGLGHVKNALGFVFEICCTDPNFEQTISDAWWDAAVYNRRNKYELYKKQRPERIKQALEKHATHS